MDLAVLTQDYLSAGLQNVVSETAEINGQLDKRAKTLRSLYTTKDVLPENQEVKARVSLTRSAPQPCWLSAGLDSCACGLRLPDARKGGVSNLCFA